MHSASLTEPYAHPVRPEPWRIGSPKESSSHSLSKISVECRTGTPACPGQTRVFVLPSRASDKGRRMRRPYKVTMIDPMGLSLRASAGSAAPKDDAAE